MKSSFDIKLDGNEFYTLCQDADTNCEYEEPTDFNAIQALAGPFKWSMDVKGKGQRKYHARSVMTNSVWAMLDLVKHELRNDCTASVRLLTPDVELLITC